MLVLVLLKDRVLLPQSSAQRGQRGANAQPGAGLVRSGARSETTGNGECGGRSSRGTASSSTFVYGMRTPVNSSPTGASSTACPAYITITVCA